MISVLVPVSAFERSSPALDFSIEVAVRTNARLVLFTHTTVPVVHTLYKGAIVSDTANVRENIECFLTSISMEIQIEHKIQVIYVVDSRLPNSSIK